VTPRRWIYCCNPELAKILTEYMGGEEEWIRNLDLLRDIAVFADEEEFQGKWRAMKLHNKKRLQQWVKDHCGIDIPTEALYDIMVKRLHEYKRQLMNILYVVHRYLMIKDTPKEKRAESFVPRVVMFGGKAAPGYAAAKAIIKLINAVGHKINGDGDIGDLLKVVYLPNYNVSNAQVIIPAAELSQHISTAGTEASGTSNMKFVMNGSLIIGTLDGANVEIAEEIGDHNMFIFGKKVHEVNEVRKQMYEGKRDYVGSRLARVFSEIRKGTFGDIKAVHGVLDNIENGGDFYLVCTDFYTYLDAQAKVDEAYRD